MSTSSVQFRILIATTLALSLLLVALLPNHVAAGAAATRAGVEPSAAGTAPAALPAQTDRPLSAEAVALQVLDSIVPGGAFGGQLAVGDIDGDGLVDLVVTAPIVEEKTGAAYLFLGEASKFATEPIWTFGGEQPEAGLGGTPIVVRDLNADGFADLVLAAARANEGAGRVYLFYGSESGLPTEPDLVLDGGQKDAYWGNGLAAGDVNGDGIADLLVGVAKSDGHIYTWFGSAAGLGDEPDVALDVAGSSLATADINGDGIDDLFATSLGEAFNGVVSIYLGQAEVGPAPLPVATIAGEGKFQLLGVGSSLAGAGDVNGDGYDELLVGARFYPEMIESTGRAYMLYGGEDLPETRTASGAEDLEWISTGMDRQDQHGWSVVGLGDLNGDGLDDLAITAPGAGQNAGRVDVFLGNVAGPALVADLNVLGDTRRDRFGSTMASLGDINGDGYADFAAAAPGYPFGNGDGRVYVFSGAELLDPTQAAQPTAWRPSSTQFVAAGEANEAFGWPALIVGDVNGDGYDDLAVNSFGNLGAGMAGRVVLYWGSGEGVGKVPDWQSSGDEWRALGYGQESPIGYTVAGLGDVNGDGYADFAATVLDIPNEVSNVAVYHGGPDGPVDEPYALAPPAGDEWEELILGIRLAAAGDVNGDGYDDAAVAGLDDAAGQVVLMVYHGGPDGLVDEPAWINGEVEAIEEMALGLAAMGDIDDDGYDDLLVGMPGYPDEDAQGRVLLYPGSPDGLGDSPIWTREGTAEDSMFGLSVASLGDANGDGHGDFAVSEPGYDDGIGRVLLVYTTADKPDEWRTDSLQLELGSGVFGALTAGPGDVNGDGFSDLLVGSVNDGRSQRLTWMLFLGGTDGVGQSPVFDVQFPISSDEFVLLQSYAQGNLNGDDYNDIVFGRLDLEAVFRDQGVSRGEALIYYGGSGERVRKTSADALAFSPEPPPSAALSAADLQIAGETPVVLENMTPLLLSPDGESLLVDAGGEAFCFLATSTMTIESCVSWQERLLSVDFQRLAWSPDSRYVAVTENVLVLFHESDIWLLDVEQSSLQNLTDDGFDRDFLRSQDSSTVPVDLLPVWSPDGSRILFVRSDFGAEDIRVTDLNVLDLDERSVTGLGTVDPNYPMAVYMGLHWMADDTIFYSTETPDRDKATNGIWRLAPESDTPEQILAENPAERNPPILVDVTPDGATGLIWYPYLAGQFSTEPEVALYALLDMETGVVEPLEPTQFDGTFWYGPSNATLSPDGSKVLYTYRDDTPQSYLAVREVGALDDNILLRSEERLGASRFQTLGLDWADNDQIFLATGRDGMLLRLEAR